MFRGLLVSGEISGSDSPLGQSGLAVAACDGRVKKGFVNPMSFVDVEERSHIGIT